VLPKKHPEGEEEDASSFEQKNYLSLQIASLQEGISRRKSNLVGVAGQRGGYAVRRIIVLAISVILALVVTAPIAAGQNQLPSNIKNQSHSNILKELAAQWWNWAVLEPSPLAGDYEDGQQCEREFIEGVFFLAGSTGGDATRTCTVPADTALFFPVLNVVCSEAPTVPTDGGFTGDPEPYSKCAKQGVHLFLKGDLELQIPEGDPFATLDGEDLTIRRIGSKPFTWKFPVDSTVFTSVPAGSYDAQTYGLWVYLPEGLPKGDHTVTFGGFFGDITYELTAV
jgi:hypothetical protein